MTLPKLPASVLVVCALIAGNAAADGLQDAQRLLKQRQLPQALEAADRVLAAKPRDAQARFLRGLILTEMNRTAEAVAEFTRLTEDYPELPEPYNNLAVIYAQQRQYDKAKHALEMAIRTHPSYATAHENLGDIYARLASQAYDKALQIDSSNVTAQSKLAMIRDLMSIAPRPGASRQGSLSPAAERSTEVKLATAVPVSALIAPKPTTANAVSAPPQLPQAQPPQLRADQPPAQARPAAEDLEIAKMVEQWAAAWSRKDIKGYLAFYASDFKTPGGESRGAWERKRESRIKKPGSIEVDIENPQVALEGADKATVKFRQHYRSAALRTSGTKVLVVVKRDGRWQIREERVST